MKENNVIYSDAFWAGYRAFVYGGRSHSYAQNSNDVFVSGGIEPFEHLPERMKKEWRMGIAYAKNEREECRQLNEGINKCDAAKYSEKQKMLVSLWNENYDVRTMSFTEIGKLVGASAYWVSSNVHKLGLSRNVKEFPNAAKEKDLIEICSTPRGRQLSFFSIAVILGVSTTWVVNHINKLGLTHDKIRDWDKWKKLEQEIEKICKSSKSKFNIAEIKAIAKRLGVSNSWVYYKVRKVGK